MSIYHIALKFSYAMEMLIYHIALKFSYAMEMFASSYTSKF
jgi:hypothetical protein